MERWQRAHPDWPADLPVALSAPGPKGQVIHDAKDQQGNLVGFSPRAVAAAAWAARACCSR